MTTLVTGNMLIGEIISRFPGSAQIMEKYGLHCTSCSVNSFEELKAGALSHGLPESTVDELIAEINDLAIARRRAPEDGLFLSETAAKKIQKFAADEDKSGYGLRITAKDNHGREPAYAMDFEEKPTADDKHFSFHGVTLMLDAESWENMKGAEIDYLETQFGSGFKITNPKFMAASGGGCGSGACGCGTGKGAGGCGTGGCC